MPAEVNEWELVDTYFGPDVIQTRPGPAVDDQRSKRQIKLEATAVVLELNDSASAGTATTAGACAEASIDSQVCQICLEEMDAANTYQCCKGLRYHVEPCMRTFIEEEMKKHPTKLPCVCTGSCAHNFNDSEVSSSHKTMLTFGVPSSSRNWW